MELCCITWRRTRKTYKDFRFEEIGYIYFLYLILTACYEGGIVTDDDAGVLISTMSALDNLVVVGGFKGECIVKNTLSNVSIIKFNITQI